MKPDPGGHTPHSVTYTLYPNAANSLRQRTDEWLPGAEGGGDHAGNTGSFWVVKMFWN